jgi:predicted Zn-dependent protease
MLRAGRRTEALDLCMAAAQEGKSAEACVALCSVLMDAPPDQAHAAQVEKILAAAVAQHPRDDRLLFYVATLRYMQGKVEEADKLYRQLLASNPKHVMAMNNLAALLAEDPRRCDQALEQIDLAISIEGPTAQLLDTRALVWIYQGKLPEAIDALHELTDGAKADPRYHFHLAMAYQRSGAMQDARASLARAEAGGLGSLVLTPSERSTLVELQKALGRSPSDKVSSTGKGDS